MRISPYPFNLLIENPIKVGLALIGIAVCFEAIRQGGSLSGAIKSAQNPGSEAKSDCGAVKRLNQCTEIDRPINGCLNALHIATINKKPYDMKKLVVEKGADIEAKDCIGQTPLHTAIYDNFPQGVATLFDLGADIENPRLASDLPPNWPNRGTQSPNGEDFAPSPLLFSMQIGSDAAARVLVEKGAKVFEPPCCSPLKRALEMANYQSSLKFLKILTKTESHPAFAACTTYDEFLDVLFEKPDQKTVLAEWQQRVDSPLVTELLSVSVPPLPKREFTSWDDLVHFLLEQNPRFKIAWNQVPEVERKSMKRSFENINTFPVTTAEAHLLYKWIGSFYFREDSAFFETMCQGTMGLDEVLTRNEMGDFYLYFADLIAGSNLSVESYHLQNLVSEHRKQNIETVRSKWKNGAALSFFTTHQDWLANRIEQLRKTP